jgi:anaerobic magnesium-protoporphyrin IX monomethyl ester cyclase
MTLPKIIAIQSSNTPVEPEVQLGGMDDKHLVMLEALQELSRKAPQKNTTAIVLNQPEVTRRTRVAMVIAPEWGAYIAPYNVARLTALAKGSGFATKAFDINIAAYQASDKTLWDGYLDWKWSMHYHEQVHPVIEPCLREWVDKIVAFAPDVIGFTLYYTNNDCTNWIIREIKQRLPNVKIIGGGPQAIQEKVKEPELYDHLVVGEGEQIFLDILEKHEAGIEIPNRVLYHDKAVRIDLDSMPWPDYSDFDLTQYSVGVGVSSEISRGCVAKCQFCSETTFWRYRGRQASNIVDEIEYQYLTFGIRGVWFIDSLVNGNLKELRAFARGLVERKVDIFWLGYARCDGRMDLDYFHDLRASGCDRLNFGIESGSQYVLDLMKKNVRRDDIEQNLIDMTTVGIGAHSNWFVGFPGERPVDMAHTMTLLWRTRKTILTGWSFTVCNVNLDTPLHNEREKFGMSHGHYANHWVTEDYTNTIIHRLVRYKTVNILLNHLRKHMPGYNGGIPIKIYYAQERPGVENHYTLTYDPANTRDTISYDDFDYNIIRPTINPLANSLVNEIWPLLRILFLAIGAFEIDLRFDPDLDMAEFGPDKCPNDQYTEYRARHQFKIDAQGDWHAVFDYDLKGGGPNGMPDLNGFHYGFKLGWEGRGNWCRHD